MEQLLDQTIKAGYFASNRGVNLTANWSLCTLTVLLTVKDLLALTLDAHAVDYQDIQTVHQNVI